MLKKQEIGINPHEENNGSRDQSLTGIRGPQVYIGLAGFGFVLFWYGLALLGIVWVGLTGFGMIYIV